MKRILYSFLATIATLAGLAFIIWGIVFFPQVFAAIFALIICLFGIIIASLSIWKFFYEEIFHNT